MSMCLRFQLLFICIAPSVLSVVITSTMKPSSYGRLHELYNVKDERQVVQE